MMKFNREPGKNEIDELKYEISFVDEYGQQASIAQTTDEIKVKKNKDGYEKLVDQEVKKNYAIVYMSSQLKEASIAYEKDVDLEKYYQTLNQVLATVDGKFDTLDEDLQYVHDLVSKQTNDEKKAEKEVLLADSF